MLATSGCTSPGLSISNSPIEIDKLVIKASTNKDKAIIANNLYNNFPYKTDHETWHKKDYWATPDEIFSKNSADCEDYALAKYVALKKGNFPIEDMIMIHAEVKDYEDQHMALIIMNDSIPYVLDNLNKEIVSLKERTDLTVLFGFNETNVFDSKLNPVNNNVKIAAWENYLNRVRVSDTIN